MDNGQLAIWGLRQTMIWGSLIDEVTLSGVCVFNTAEFIDDSFTEWGMAIFWALMRTSSLMNFFQTKWDLNRWINGVPRYRGHGSMLCRGFQKSSKLFFSEITLAVHVGMNKTSWTVDIRGPLQYLQWVPECQTTESQTFLRKSHFWGDWFTDPCHNR